MSVVFIKRNGKNSPRIPLEVTKNLAFQSEVIFSVDLLNKNADTFPASSNQKPNLYSILYGKDMKFSNLVIFFLFYFFIWQQLREDVATIVPLKEIVVVFLIFNSLIHRQTILLQTKLHSDQILNIGNIDISYR